MAELCLSCSLCCTHGLFSSLPVKADEVDRLRARRLPIVERGDGWSVRFPCAAHHGNCSIYPDRPSACARYECSVLVAVRRAEMREPDARDLLARTNALVAALRARIPGEGEFWSDVAGYCQESQEWRLAHVELLLDVAELRALLRRVDPKANEGEEALPRQTAV